MNGVKERVKKKRRAHVHIRNQLYQRSSLYVLQMIGIQYTADNIGQGRKSGNV